MNQLTEKEAKKVAQGLILGIPRIERMRREIDDVVGLVASLILKYRGSVSETRSFHQSGDVWSIERGDFAGGSLKIRIQYSYVYSQPDNLVWTDKSVDLPSASVELVHSKLHQLVQMVSENSAIRNGWDPFIKAGKK